MLALSHEPQSIFAIAQHAGLSEAETAGALDTLVPKVSHLLLIDVRIKGGRPARDPLTETVAVFACGRSAREIQVPEEKAATCAECVAAIAEP